MGADLYITTLFQRRRQQWEPELERAMRLRDSCSEGTEEYRQADARVGECHDRLYESGYFRDPYNDWDLLWQFGLSWCDDVIPMLDADFTLSVVETENLLALLREREETFESRLAQMQRTDREYFRNRYAALTDFLREAIKLNAPIQAWL